MFRLAGLVEDVPADVRTRRLRAMLESMRRHPSDVTRLYSLPELHCHLGWISPAVPLGDQVIREMPGRLLLVAGECLSDCGVLLETPGRVDEALRRLDGWFSGAIADTEGRCLRLFNDRFNLRRLYYRDDRGRFLFASEAKAVFAAQSSAPRWDTESLAQWIGCGDVMHDRTLFEGVHVLPAASCWTIRGAGRIERGRYFSADDWENQPPLTARQFESRLKDVLARVIPKYLSGPRVGLSLTGGVDSRLISAFRGRPHGGVAAFTFAGMYRDCYDVKIAAAVAKACGYEHHVLRLDSRFLQQFPKAAEETVWATDGTLDIGASHEVYLNRLAREIAPVRVTGNYGSEILRGVSTFRPKPADGDLLERSLRPAVSAAHEALNSARRSHPVSFAVFSEIPWHLFGRLNAGQQYAVQRSPYTDIELVALAYQAAPAVRLPMPLWNRVIAGQDHRLAAIPNDRGHIATSSTAATFPGRLWNYALFKAEWYYEGGTPDWLARLDHTLFAGGRPPFFVGTHKIENYRLWLRGALHEYVHSVLSDPCVDSIPGVRWDRSRGWLDEHRRGTKNYARHIISAATLALIDKLLIRGARRPAAPVDTDAASAPLQIPAPV